MNVRPIAAGSSREIVDVLRIFNRSLPRLGWDAQQVAYAQRRAALTGTIVVATDDTEVIIGCGWLKELLVGIRQATVVVDPVCRRRGAGSALLDALVAETGGIPEGTELLVDRTDRQSTDFAVRRLDAVDRHDPAAPPLSFELCLGDPLPARPSEPTCAVVEVGPGHDLFDATLDLYERLVPGPMGTRAETVAWETERLEVGGLLLAAVADGEVIGVCVASDVPWASQLYSDYTLVRDDWRRLGVATTLKAHQREVARRRGLSRIVTDIPTMSSPMAEVLRRSGYEPWERQGLFSGRSVLPPS